MVLNKTIRLRLPFKAPWIKQSQLLWWLEIKTAQPLCTYYFGPFVSRQEAMVHQADYVEDLVNEQAKGITIKLKQCQPKELTICSEP